MSLPCRRARGRARDRGEWELRRRWRRGQGSGCRLRGRGVTGEGGRLTTSVAARGAGAGSRAALSRSGGGCRQSRPVPRRCAECRPPPRTEGFPRRMSAATAAAATGGGGQEFRDLADVEATCDAMYDTTLPEPTRKAAEMRLVPLAEQRETVPMLQVRVPAAACARMRLGTSCRLWRPCSPPVPLLEDRRTLAR